MYYSMHAIPTLFYLLCLVWIKGGTRRSRVELARYYANFQPTLLYSPLFPLPPHKFKQTISFTHSNKSFSHNYYNIFYTHVYYNNNNQAVYMFIIRCKTIRIIKNPNIIKPKLATNDAFKDFGQKSDNNETSQH